MCILMFEYRNSLSSERVVGQIYSLIWLLSNCLNVHLFIFRPGLYVTVFETYSFSDVIIFITAYIKSILVQAEGQYLLG